MATLIQLPDVVDLSFVAGDTFKIRVRVMDPNLGEAIVVDPDPAEEGEPGEYKFCAEIARTSDHKIVAQFEVEDDPDAAPPGSAKILILPPSETAALPGMGSGEEFKGIWDLEVKFPSGDIRTVVKGTVTCILDVSNCDSPDPAVQGMAGTPGTWYPQDEVTLPASVSALQASSIVATPRTPWTTGQYIQTGTAGSPGQAYWNGTAWVAGTAP